MRHFNTVSTRLLGLFTALTLFACGGPIGEEESADTLPLKEVSMFQSTGSQKICTVLLMMPNGASTIISVPAPASWTGATCKAYGQAQSPYANSYQLTCQFDTSTPSLAFSFGTNVSIGSTAPAPPSNCGW